MNKFVHPGPAVVRFTVPAVPVAQPRQRHALVGGSVRNYTPGSHPVQAFKATVRLAAQAAYNGPPLAGPLHLSALFLLPRPGRLRWKTRPTPRLLHAAKPDLDNLLKAVKDALKGTVWVDDSQVACVVGIKMYAAGGEQPGVEISVAECDTEV